MTHRFRALSLALAVALAAGVAACEAGAKEPFGSLTLDEAAAKLGTPNVFFVDNNPADVWQRGHVPGAKWVDYSHVTTADLPADKNATLVFYCANEH